MPHFRDGHPLNYLRLSMMGLQCYSQWMDLNMEEPHDFMDNLAQPYFRKLSTNYRGGQLQI